MNKRGFLAIIFLIVGPFFSSTVSAEEFNSATFKVSNPTMNAGGYSSSASFKLQSSISQISIGTSTALSFGINSGFLYFPQATTPTVSATAGDGQVALSWTASTGFLGWTVGGYSVGQSTTSGGPYTYTAVGNVTSNTATSLTNSTTYYFVIIAKDSASPSNFIATSTQVSATPVAASPTPTPTPSLGGGGGGGGGGGILSTQTTVNFSGRAYPKSTVTLLKDAQVAASTVAGATAMFQISLTGISAGNYIFSVYGEDKDGRRSSLQSFPASVTSGATTNVSGIFIAPTIATDKSEVKKGDNISILGQSAPQSNITIVVNSDEEYYATAKSDANGVYLANFDTTVLEYGGHTTKSKSAVQNEISAFGQVTAFIVGTKNVLAKAPSKCPMKADLNSDCKVNLTDFSIAAYWYKRTLSVGFAVIEKEELNGDGKITLTDFSIMAYYWTG